LGGRWSIEGNHILFQRNVGGVLQLFQLTFGRGHQRQLLGETQLTMAPAFNVFPNWDRCAPQSTLNGGMTISRTDAEKLSLG
jgi:hypothetical protein